ncbi:MAG: GTPase HflX, partial [candidate division FCPU426 bacterium]
DALSRLGGGIGTRGPGETKLETDRRRLRDRISYLSKEIEAVARTRSLHRDHRKKGRAYSVALAGYTNAGKSSLFNVLTEGAVPVEDRLFATLDPTVRPLTLPAKAGTMTVLISDTVGFIRKLPHALVAAFKSTLEEIAHADLIIRVQDCGSADFRRHLETVDQVLEEILKAQGMKPLAERDSMLVFNKADLLSAEASEALRREWPEALQISALEGQGLETLCAAILQWSEKGLREQKYFFPPDKAGLVSRHFEALSVQSQTWSEEGLSVEALLKAPIPELDPYKVEEA